jgi:hypothetical protein
MWPMLGLSLGITTLLLTGPERSVRPQASRLTNVCEGPQCAVFTEGVPVILCVLKTCEVPAHR